MRIMRNTSTIAIAAAFAAFTANAAFAQDATTPAAPDATVQPVAPTDPAMAPTTGTDMGTGAAAQTSPDATMPTATPDTGVAQTPPVTGTTAGTDMAASAEPFVQMQQEDQFLGSRLMGADVISAANEDIGDVNDVLFDQSGRAVAILVGIGGFLGIGEKDVAIPFERLTIHRGDENGQNLATLRVGLETTRAELEAAPSFERVDDAAMTGATTEGVTPTDPAAPAAPALPNAGTAPSTAQ